MNDCRHSLNFIGNILVSQPFPRKCNLCGKPVYRKHIKLDFILKVFRYPFGLGFPIILLFLLSIVFLPLIVAGLVLLIIEIWLIDVKLEDLEEFTDEVKHKDHRKNIVVFIFLVEGLLLVLYTNPT